MIAIVWLISIAIASPILAGLNDTPDRDANQCAFNNQKFLVYSSVISFYIPTTVMIFLYYKIFRVIRSRAKIAKLRNTNSKTKPLLAESKLPPNKNVNKESPKQIALHDMDEKKLDSNKRNSINFVSTGIFTLKNVQIGKETPVKSNGELHQVSNSSKETNIDDKGTCAKILTQHSNEEGLTNDTNVDEKTMPLLSKETNLVNDKKKALNPLVGAKVKNSNLANQASNKERKVTKTLAIVVIVFLVCW